MRTGLASLADEIELVYTRLVLPGWGGPLHGLHRTLYGYVMNVFSFIDLLSQYRTGTTSVRGQTERMIDLMSDYMGYKRLQGSVAVRMWRHKLIHTATPQVLAGQPSGRRYRWLIHWREHLPRDQQMEFQRTPDTWILNIGLVYLVEDLRAGVERFLTEVEGSSELQARLIALHGEIIQPETFEE